MQNQALSQVKNQHFSSKRNETTGKGKKNASFRSHQEKDLRIVQKFLKAIEHNRGKNSLQNSYHRCAYVQNINAEKIIFKFGRIRRFRSLVFICGQKMVLRAFYYIITVTITLKHYCIKRSQRHLLPAINNYGFEAAII